jgi:aminoglycoside phosphotransferase (APT) family kinase protein
MTARIDWSSATLPQALRQALQSGLPDCAQGRLDIRDLRVLQMRRSSSRHRHPHPVTLSVELDVHDAALAATGVQRLYGKAYRAGASAAAFAQARQVHWAQPPFGPALAHLPALDMLWWAWPNDPGLPQLPLLLDALRLPAALPAALQQHRVLQVQVLRHEPEQRATLCCDLQAPSGRTLRIYGKTFCDARGAAIRQRFEQMAPLAAQHPQAALVAPPLAYDSGTHTLWQGAAPGQPLMTLANEAALLQTLQALGAALAHLHGQPAPVQPLPLPHRSVAQGLKAAAQRRSKIERVAPELAPRVAAVAQALLAAAATLPAPLETLVHGDMHPEQVWAHQGRVLLFDFDEWALGNPMEDLAAFITRLRQMPTPAAVAEARVDALLQGHRRAAPGLWQPGWLRWQLALQSLLQASRAFIFQQPGWQQALDQRLARAEHHANALNEVCA